MRTIMIKGEEFRISEEDYEKVVGKTGMASFGDRFEGFEANSPKGFEGFFGF